MANPGYMVTRPGRVNTNAAAKRLVNSLLWLAGISLAALIVIVVYSALVEGRNNYLDNGLVLATSGLALATLFSGCAIYLGFLTAAEEQAKTRRQQQIREAVALLGRFRIDPWLKCFITIVDSSYSRRIPVPSDGVPIVGETAIDFEPEDLGTFIDCSLGGIPYPPEHYTRFTLYADAFNAGLDYLTEVARLVDVGVIPYEDLSSLAYFFDRLKTIADGKVVRYVESWKYDAVSRLLARDTASISR